ncbi:NAD(P)H-dependent oxidoreductase [Gemmobacter caeruleus]|uniref:NAD(P)H-dependent oxidoreductase n=1 Tax=Gemmobacter caeruleus TaxID=2595004 RepID=UPI00193A5B79|nr:NAD(P)H-dependent oxidoreductase [Gemmobacter caeruleus]
MTRVLVVSAHPLPDSLTAHLARRLVAQAQAAGAEVEWLDLSAAGFDPVLTGAERATTYAPPYDGRAVAEEMAQLARAELLVLVFPTWWFGLPAQMKGWLDRVWAPGLAYDHRADLGRIVGRLTGLRGVMVATTLGAATWVDWLVMRQPLRRVLKWGVVRFCAPRARFVYHALHSAEAASPARIARHEARLMRSLTTLLSSCKA